MSRGEQEGFGESPILQVLRASRRPRPRQHRPQAHRVGRQHRPRPDQGRRLEGSSRRIRRRRGLSKKKAQGEVRKLLNYLSHLGQRCNITRIAAKHLLIKGKGKSHIRNEARSFTYLPIASTGETSILHRESLGLDKKRPGVRTPDGRPSSRATPGSRCWSANRLSVGSTTRPICDPAGSHPLPQFIIFWALMRIFIERLPEHLRVVLYLAVCDVLILASKNVFEAGGEPLRQTSR